MDKIPETHACPEKEQALRAGQSRKREIDSAGDDEPLAKRTRLTRKNLALFDKMGKNKKPESSDGSTKTTSTTTSGFAIQARKNGILDPFGSQTPTNHEARRERGAESRGTTSPTESEHRRFVKRIAGAPNEATIVVETSKLLKEYDDDGYTRAFNQAFTAFPKDVGFNNGLSNPQPDFAEGTRMQDYLPFPVDEVISGSVLYKDNPNSLTLPHLAGEWKGPNGNMEEARVQSAYDGAALAYARREALTYLGKPDPPGHAEITTFTTDGTNLHLFAHHTAETEDKTLEYHQYSDASYNLMKFNEYKDGRRHLRNEQDHAREKSYRLRDQLKEHWKQQRHGGLRPVAEAATLPASDYEPSALTGAYEETAQGEDEAGYEVIERPYQPTPAASSQPRKASHSHSSSKSSHNSGNDSHKRKASSSQTSSPGSPVHVSKHRSYWKKDHKTEKYYHKHSDGSVSWLDGDDDGR